MKRMRDPPGIPHPDSITTLPEGRLGMIPGEDVAPEVSSMSRGNIVKILIELWVA